MENWRELEPTDKQIDLIRNMERFVSPPFRGSTRGEACDWIEKHKAAIELVYSNEWALKNGYC